MVRVIINKSICKGCALCVSVCSKNILKLSEAKINDKGYFPAECIDVETCIGCTFCALMCPDVAIEIQT
jgi:2-oxoglutarate ferredoxin oxidoreductase subunit delta